MFLRDDQNLEPGIHALVIGVGDYPLLGGLKLGPVTTSVLSALAFLEFIETELAHPRLRLKSLQSLLSPAPGQVLPGPVRWSPADFTNIEKALFAWKTRLDSEPGNHIGIFYFCGHGLYQNGVTALLPADFDAALPNFMRSFDINAIRAGLLGGRTTQFYYFVDCCRTPPRTLPPAAMLNAYIPFTSATPFPKYYPPLYYASCIDQQAFGSPTGITTFTDAVLRSFRGGAAIAGMPGYLNRWVVDYDSMKMSIKRIMDFLKRYEGAPVQESAPEGNFAEAVEPLHIIPDGQARIPAAFTCNQDIAHLEFRGELSKHGPKEFVKRLLKIPDLPLLSDGDIYRLIATDGAVKYKVKPSSLAISPPVYERDLTFTAP
jgi:hypothetical protein